MPIASSLIAADDQQADLRRSIIEHHIDHLAIVYRVYYLAEQGADVNATMSIRVAQIDSNLAKVERQRNIRRILNGRPHNSLTFEHSTRPSFHNRLRELYTDAVGLDAIYISNYFDTRTNTTLRDVFSYTNPQVNTMRSNRFTPHIATLADISTAVGE